MKPNCYDCKWRRGIAGDAHSQCVHPDSGNKGDDPLMGLVAMLGKRMGPTHGIESLGSDKLGISGDPHGVRSGWFMWPINFDPVWLKSCNGFESKENE